MRRSLYLAGRIGTCLFVIGLALYLVYLIPSISFNSTASSSAGPILPEKYQDSTIASLSPTRGVHVEATANQSFRTVLFGVNYDSFYNWTNNWAHENGGAEIAQTPFGPLYNGFDNYSALQAYITQFPSQVLLDATGNSGQPVIRDYTPVSETNATFTIANPTAQALMMNYTISYLASVAPKGATLLLAEIFMPVGLILALPWVYGMLSARRKQNPATVVKS